MGEVTSRTIFRRKILAPMKELGNCSIEQFLQRIKQSTENAVMWFSQYRSGIRDKDAIQSTRKLQGRSGGSFLVIGTNILPLVSPMHN